MNSIGIWTNEISRKLAQSHDVTVFARGGVTRRKGIGDQVCTRFLPSLPPRWTNRLLNTIPMTPGSNRPFFASPFYYLTYILQAAIDIRNSKTDIVHIQNYSQFAPIVRYFAPWVKIALHMRCEWLTQLDWAMINRRLERVDYIFGISEYITQKIRERFPKAAAKCQTIANGVDPGLFFPNEQGMGNRGEENRVILSVGRISPEKGTHNLVEAFTRIANRFPDAQLRLVGSFSQVNKKYIISLSDEDSVSSLGVFYSGHYIDTVRSMVASDLGNRVEITGGVPYHEVANQYRQAYLLANPSLSESFGRSLIEANACEVPVIASRAGGMTEIVDNGINGLLVEPNDIQNLADALCQLLENRPMRNQMGRNGRTRILECYTWDQVSQDLLAAYQNA
jgi:glycosyltransferase involved in cell wall biosynthesis